MIFYNTDLNEQETTIVIDYYARILSIYSSRKSVIQRLYNKLGKPNKIDYINNAITGARWNIPFADKRKMNIALSKPLLVGQMK